MVWSSDRSHFPIKQLAALRSAIRAWCCPLLLLLGGRVVALESAGGGKSRFALSFVWAVLCEKLRKKVRTRTASMENYGISYWNQGNRLTHSRRKKLWALATRSTLHGSDLNQISGRASRVGVISVLPKSVCTKRKIGKNTNLTLQMRPKPETTQAKQTAVHHKAAENTTHKLIVLYTQEYSSNSNTSASSSIVMHHWKAFRY